MSLINYMKFGEVLSSNGLENKFSVNESIAIAEDISLMENTPLRITNAITEKYEGIDGLDVDKLISDIKESFNGVFESSSFIVYLKKGSLKHKLVKDVKSKKEADKAVDLLDIPDEFDGSGWMTKSEWDKLSKGQIIESDSSDSDEDDDEDTVENDAMDGALNVLLSEAVTEALMLIAEEDDEDDEDEDDEDEDYEDEDDVKEGARPKRLTGAAKKQRDAKSHLMKLLNKDPEISAFKERAKAKIIKLAKQKGKKAGIKVQRINFDKIKL